MIVTEIAITGENKFKLTSYFPKKNECKRIEIEFVKLEDGTYYHKSDWGEKRMKIVSTDCETYILFDVKMQKKEKTSSLVAMYTKKPELPDHLKKMFLEHGRSVELRDDQMILPTEVACPNEA
ncbi:extracellular fatty acid-binding protein-like [Paroedura picta]|uniref:extracellular fatty acid-binding protein-like n=1 Tax=Paroedura picta TaxID=143630 RepID=UPI004056FDC9